MGRENKLSDKENEALAERVKELLARRRMSRQQLASAAKISISTLEKALNGSRPFTPASVVRIEEALKVTLGKRITTTPPALQELGGYSRNSVTWLEGDYLTLRPSFELPNTIFAYRTKVIWDEGRGCLTFLETERTDASFSQRGVVSMPNKSGHIYLYTNEDGHRLSNQSPFVGPHYYC